MNETPTPRTDAFYHPMIARTLQESKDFARQLERELNEARLRYEVLLQNYNADTISLVASERDQLRKVCDELASTIYVHSLRPQNALDGYNQLPHVQERKTK